MNRLRTRMDATAKNNAKKQSMSAAIGLINSFYPTNKDKERLVRDIQEYGIFKVAHMSNFNAKALDKVYQGYMLEKSNKAKKKNMTKEKKDTTGFSNFIIPEKLIIELLEYNGKFVLLCGQDRRSPRGEVAPSEESAKRFIYKEARQNLKLIKEYAGNKNNWKSYLSPTDYEYAKKWDYYFTHLDTINSISKLNVSLDQHLYIQEFLTGSGGFDNHKRHKGRQVDFRKLNDMSYSLKQTVEDIDLICKLVQNYQNNSQKQKAKRKK